MSVGEASRFRPYGKRRWLLAAVAGSILAGGALAGVAWRQQTNAEDKSEAIRNAVNAGAVAGDRPAATVNGVAIPESRLISLGALAGLFPTPGLDLSDRAAVLEMLIRGELLYQEAASRGLLPSEAEVYQQAVLLEAGVKAARDSGNLPSDPAAMLSGLEKLGTPLEEFDTSPIILETLRRTMARTRLSNSLGADLPQTGPPGVQDPRRAEIVNARLTELYRELRAKASIETFDAPASR